MAEELKRVECPVCAAPAARLMADKRGKLYINCECGRQTFNTHKGQAMLRRLVEEQEPEQQENQKQEPEQEPEKSEKTGGAGGVLALVAITAATGAALWKIRTARR